MEEATTLNTVLIRYSISETAVAQPAPDLWRGLVSGHDLQSCRKPPHILKNKERGEAAPKSPPRDPWGSPARRSVPAVLPLTQTVTTEKNKLYYGDNLEVLKLYVKDESVDLVYLDPPFNSRQDYNVLFAEKDGSQSSSQIHAFEDTWEWNPEAMRAYEQIAERPT